MINDKYFFTSLLRNKQTTYLTEQHKQPFLNSSHSSYKFPACPTATLFSNALPTKDDTWCHRKCMPLLVTLHSKKLHRNEFNSESKSHSQCADMWLAKSTSHSKPRKYKLIYIGLNKDKEFYYSMLELRNRCNP